MHLRSVAPLVLFAATAASTVACSKWAPEAPTPATPMVPIPPGPAPDHGVAHVEISGAIEARHDSAMACAPDRGMGLSVHEPRARAVGHPGWSLAVYQFGIDPARVELTEGGVDWVGELPPGVVPTASEIAFSDLVLSSEDGKTVKASATLRCPDLVTHAVPEGLVAVLHDASGAEVRPFVGADFGRAKDARGISVKVDPGSTKALVSALRGKLPTGWVAYVGTSRDLSGEMPSGDPRAELTHEVAIGPSADARDIVRLAHVDPVNYGLDSETLQADIPTGADIPKLAVEVAEFCPDVVDQGAGTVEALAAEMARTNNLYGWWD